MIFIEIWFTFIRNLGNCTIHLQGKPCTCNMYLIRIYWLKVLNNMQESGMFWHNFIPNTNKSKIMTANMKNCCLIIKF